VRIIKKEKEVISESFLESLIGRYIHVPVNEHVTYDPMEKDFVKVNAWFAGKVAGYEKTIYAYDYKENKFFDEPKTVYKVLLCDGMAYVISEEKSLFKELTEEEFLEMLAEHDVKKASKVILSEGV
jgi:hypothetical protein